MEKSPIDPEVLMVQAPTEYPSLQAGGDDDALAVALRRLLGAWMGDEENPFGHLLEPGQTAVIKPNWVVDHNLLGHSIDSLITHPSLIEHVARYCAVALEGRGTIVLGDAPVQICDFANLIACCQLTELVSRLSAAYPGIDFRVEDWRLTTRAVTGISEWSQQTRSPSASEEEFVLVDLADRSFLEDLAEYSPRFRVTCYDPHLMIHHHAPGKHEYLVARRALDADLLINLPKIKTHKRAGLTCSLKNLVGINGHKEYLPHHIKGSYFEGGDFSCSKNRFMRYWENLSDKYWAEGGNYSPLGRIYYRGLLFLLPRLAKASGGDGTKLASWAGNETVWRMTLDLNHLLYFGTRRPRNVITLVDGVVAGQGEGPLTPEPRPLGMLLAGGNPAHIDAVVARVMGYNVSRVPTVQNAIFDRRSRFGTEAMLDFPIRALDAEGEISKLTLQDVEPVAFRKPRHWLRAELPEAAPA